MFVEEIELPLNNISTVRSLVDQIREYIGADDQTEDDEIKRVWRHYCAVCRQVNQRLGECSELLDDGAWYEAVRLAETKPDLLNVINVLDFDERDEWEQLGADFGWERLAKVTFERAEHLFEAYENKRQLDPLLQKHIRLTLSESPLNDRLRVMRELMKRDSFSTFWRQDVEEFERVRFTQLLRLADYALDQEDFALVGEVVEEFNDTHWEARPPKRVAKRLAEVEFHLLRTIELPAISEELTAAYTDGDANSGRRLRSAWKQLDERLKELDAGWQVPTKLRKTVEPCLKWLRSLDKDEKRQQEWNAAVNDLMQVCSAKSLSWDAIARSERQLKLLGRPIPADVANRIRAARWRIVGNIAFILFFAVVGLALAIFLVVLFLPSTN